MRAGDGNQCVDVCCTVDEVDWHHEFLDRSQLNLGWQTKNTRQLGTAYNRETLCVCLIALPATQFGLGTVYLSFRAESLAFEVFN